MEAPDRESVAIAIDSPCAISKPKNEFQKAPGSPLNSVKSFMSKFSKNWIPSNSDSLEKAEAQMLQAFDVKYEQKFVSANDIQINTIVTGEGSPVVLIHGFASGLGLWVHNIKDLSKHHKVYAIDLPGFGRSSRKPFLGKTHQEAEEYFVDALEAWRKSVGLEEKFVLIGHSFGGCVSGLYGIKYPSSISKLILADPWGISHFPGASAPFSHRIVKPIAGSMNPLSFLRLAGPYGPSLIHKLRKDLVNKFSTVYTPEITAEYLYHLNAQPPSGEAAFRVLHVSFRWARQPLCERLHMLPEEVPLTILYGSNTWLTREEEDGLKAKIGRPVTCHTIPDSGHHIYADNSSYFNEYILSLTKSAPLL